MKEKVNLDDSKGITILKDKGYNLKLEVDTKKTSISEALKKFVVAFVGSLNNALLQISTHLSWLKNRNKKVE